MSLGAHYNPHRKQLTNSERAAFRRRVRRFYAAHGRRLPWRPPTIPIRHDGTVDPYRITVSEIMLQQTQVSRVIPAYRNFLRLFPNTGALANADLADVLTAWSGLGYNRRAKMLWRLAQTVRDEYGGTFPKNEKTLQTLPGIGEYTAGAITTFAYNEPTFLLETNIRTVFIHEFFSQKKDVHDDALSPLIWETLDRHNPREWYAALMDYGNHIKQIYGNVGARSAHHMRQSTFAGSKRQLRGVILKELTARSRGATAHELSKRAGRTHAETCAQLDVLIKEGLCAKKGNRYKLGSE